MNHIVSVYRLAHFNAAHRLYRKDWTDQKNRDVFGLCANPHWHGHNYKLEVCVSGEVDRETGYLIDLKDLNQMIQDQVIERFDHRNLNEDTQEFKDLNPTGENIVWIIWQLLREKLDSRYRLSVKLWETDRNYFRFPAES
jgi:6-pyruvoyltetrahydropterin/6-carboxytetrahydropterin synthase